MKGDKRDGLVWSAEAGEIRRTHTVSCLDACSNERINHLTPSLRHIQSRVTSLISEPCSNSTLCNEMVFVRLMNYEIPVIVSFHPLKIRLRSMLVTLHYCVRVKTLSSRLVKLLQDTGHRLCIGRVLL